MPDTEPGADMPPRWNLATIFPGFESPEFRNAKESISAMAREFDGMLSRLEAAARPGVMNPSGAAALSPAEFLPVLREMLDLINREKAVSETLGSYCYAVYSADTTDTRAMNELNAVEEALVPFSPLFTRFRSVLARHEPAVRILVESEPDIAPYRSMLDDELFWASRQMAPGEESLAADLARSGASAWSRLQEQLISTADCLWDESTGERKTLVELRALAFSPDRAIREKAWRKEMDVCASIAVPVAAALNGVKGTNITLNTRRGWPGGAFDAAIEKSVRQGLLSRKALDALLSVMEESLPHWRRYLKAKARLAGRTACSFFDLFAPVGETSASFSFAEARAVVEGNFTKFSSDMGLFARKAFDGGWLDAEMRSGKIGGAYFTFMPLVKEGRVLCNFDGSFSSVLTMAHELGHAYHADVLKDEPAILQSNPMTLAETASIFAETVVFDAAYERAADTEKLALLEMHLQDGCQILVDILSRYRFEKSLFESRKEGELSSETLCDLMLQAQEETYGDGLDPDARHPYLWLVKPHYYSSELAFYNFPYAFGQLFALALYSRFRKEGPAFAGTYRDILSGTGRLDALAVTREAGFDIEDTAFWESGVSLFIGKIDEFEKLVDAQTASH